MECLVFSSVQRVEFSRKKIEHVVLFVLKQVKINGSVSVHLIGDKKMRSLNATYRGKDSTTDVLSFAMGDNKERIYGGEDELGDIFISIPQIRRQASTYRVPYAQEFTRMLVHGVLHIVGFDHIHETDAQKMFSLQEHLITECI
ncbi:MAG TPA: rRNA maturation RNase YbeY [Candidatus Magasanikbacteria bacterium]|nr:rRNA maturation RNase YbeY [Candidatus Magasanikbacteria bacterium]